MEDLDDFELAERAIREWIDSYEGWDEEFPEESTKKRRKREEKIDCWASAWGQLIRHPEVSDCNSAKGKLFRRRFRVPFPLFNEILVPICRQKNIFKTQRKSRIDIEFKILLVLRILGRGNCADDINEFIPAIGHSTINTIFHVFCQNFVSEFYSKYVNVPTGKQMKKVMEVYSRLGLPGAMGSMDCTHVRWDRCPRQFTNHCVGKEGFPTLAFQVVVDHSRRIHHVSRYFFGACNDQQITNNDTYPREFMQGRYRKVTYELKTSTGRTVKVSGGYLIVDGGYQKYVVFINPMHSRMSRDAVLWSEWMESVRKDVECTFGILKVSLISDVVCTR